MLADADVFNQRVLFVDLLRQACQRQVLVDAVQIDDQPVRVGQREIAVGDFVVGVDKNACAAALVLYLRGGNLCGNVGGIGQRAKQ